MKFEHHKDPTTDQRTYTLTIDGGDMLCARLSPMDMRVLGECGGEDASVADRLLGLELLARRIEEANR